MLGRRRSAPGTYSLPPGSMKSAWVSTSQNTTFSDAMALGELRLREAYNIVWLSREDWSFVFRAFQQQLDKLDKVVTLR
jgi:hypothetical protein